MAALEEIIRKLEAAQGDVRAQAVITADFALAVRPEEDREQVRAALDAAAVLRWFDAPLLAGLLEIGETEARALFDVLAGLSFVERFPSGAGDVRNVHDATRLGWRHRLSQEQPEVWRALSARAAARFAQDSTPSGRVEWIYHLLSADPEAGAIALQELDRAWGNTARPENRQALALALGELEETGLVAGQARLEVLLCIAEARSSRGETARLGTTARTVLELAHAVGDPRGLARAYSLSGDVWQAQGKLEKALSAFQECLVRCGALAAKDPGNAGWQGDLATAHCSVGDVLQAQGKLEEAQAEFGQYLAIGRQLVKQDSNNAGWQRKLAVAHSRVGEVLEDQRNLEDAQSAFEESLKINRQLAERDPSNTGWQREVAAAHSNLGRVLQARGKLEDAQAEFEEDLKISRMLAEQDPTNAGWQRDLAVSHSAVGGVLQAKAQLEAAQSALSEALAINRLLTERDPSSAEWWHELALALTNCGLNTNLSGKKQHALSFYREARNVSDHLMLIAPGFVEWEQERERLLQALAKLETELEAAGEMPGTSSE